MGSVTVAQPQQLTQRLEPRANPQVLVPYYARILTKLTADHGEIYHHRKHRHVSGMRCGVLLPPQPNALQQWYLS